MIVLFLKSVHVFILGDNDAVMLVLLMPRLLAKCQVLISQVRDKFPAVSTVDKTTIVKAQQFSAMSRFSTHIYMLMVSTFIGLHLYLSSMYVQISR